jgi:predicted dehydrogenase
LLATTVIEEEKMAKYRVGIIGLSWITRDPAAPGTALVLGPAPAYSHASAYAATPDIEVVAGCDIDPEACEAFLNEWKSTWPNVRTYTDYREMLKAGPFDILSIVTPDNLHRQFVLAGIEAGIPAMFCEKPIATDLADADAMIAAIEQAGTIVNVNHTRRWMPSHVAAREAIRAGDIGELTQITVHFGGPRAMLWRNHSHMLDLICYYAEANPVSVVGELEPGSEDYGTSYRGNGGRDADLEPGANAYIAFDNGVHAFLAGMKRGLPRITVDLIGTTGRIHATDQSATKAFAVEGGFVEQPIVPKGTLAGMHAAVVDLITAMETGREVQSPPREARKAVALIQGILDSQAAGNARVAVDGGTSRSSKEG